MMIMMTEFLNESITRFLFGGCVLLYLMLMVLASRVMSQRKYSAFIRVLVLGGISVLFAIVMVLWGL